MRGDGRSGQSQRLLDRIRAGDEDACWQLIVHTGKRLKSFVRRMLGRQRRVHNIMMTDDVLLEVMIKLKRALDKGRIETVTHYFRYANDVILNTLRDVARKYCKPPATTRTRVDRAQAYRGHRATGSPGSQGGAADLAEVPDRSALEPWVVLQREEFYEAVRELPEDQREAFGLLRFQGLFVHEVAEIMGYSERTVKRLMQRAKRAIGRRLRLDDHLPE